MELKTQISNASKLINYLKENRYIEIKEAATDIQAAVNAYMSDDFIRELVNMMLDGKAWVTATNNIIAYEPVVGKTGAKTLAEALRELNLPQGNAARQNLKYYQLFAQIAGIVLPQLLFTQKSDSGSLVKGVTTTTAWLNTIKEDVLEKFDDAKSKELLTFINDLGSQQDERNKRKDLKILDKVLQKWFFDNKYVTRNDGQSIYPTEYFEFVIERMLENYDSEYAEIMNKMTAELLNVRQESNEGIENV